MSTAVKLEMQLVAKDCSDQAFKTFNSSIETATLSILELKEEFSSLKSDFEKASFTNANSSVKAYSKNLSEVIEKTKKATKQTDLLITATNKWAFSTAITSTGKYSDAIDKLTNSLENLRKQSVSSKASAAGLSFITKSKKSEADEYAKVLKKELKSNQKKATSSQSSTKGTVEKLNIDDEKSKVDTYTKSLKQLDERVKKLSSSTNELKKATKALTTTAKSLGTTIKKTSFDKVDKSATKADKSSTKLRMSLSNLRKEMSLIKTVTGPLSLAFGAMFTGMAASDFLKTGIRAEQMRNSLAAATGTIEDATNAEGFQRQESERLGLVFEDQLVNYKKIAAAARGTKMEGEGVKEMFSGIAEAATAVNIPAEEVSGTFTAFSQILSKGQVMAEELSGQLGDRLYGALQIASRGMGMTTERLMKMLKTSRIAATDFIPKFIKALKETYSVETSGATESVQSNINRLKNRWNEFQTSIMNSSAMDMLSAKLSKINDGLKNWIANNQTLTQTILPHIIDQTSRYLENFGSALSKIGNVAGSVPKSTAYDAIGTGVGIYAGSKITSIGGKALKASGEAMGRARGASSIVGALASIFKTTPVTFAIGTATIAATALYGYYNGPKTREQLEDKKVDHEKQREDLFKNFYAVPRHEAYQGITSPEEVWEQYKIFLKEAIEKINGSKKPITARNKIMKEYKDDGRLPDDKAFIKMRKEGETGKNLKNIQDTNSAIALGSPLREASNEYRRDLTDLETSLKDVQNLSNGLRSHAQRAEGYMREAEQVQQSAKGLSRNAKDAAKTGDMETVQESYTQGKHIIEVSTENLEHLKNTISTNNATQEKIDQNIQEFSGKHKKEAQELAKDKAEFEAKLAAKSIVPGSPAAMKSQEDLDDRENKLQALDEEMARYEDLRHTNEKIIEDTKKRREEAVETLKEQIKLQKELFQLGPEAQKKYFETQFEKIDIIDERTDANVEGGQPTALKQNISTAQKILNATNEQVSYIKKLSDDAQKDIKDAQEEGDAAKKKLEDLGKSLAKAENKLKNSQTDGLKATLKTEIKNIESDIEETQKAIEAASQLNKTSLAESAQVEERLKLAKKYYEAMEAIIEKMNGKVEEAQKTYDKNKTDKADEKKEKDQKEAEEKYYDEVGAYSESWEQFLRGTDDTLAKVSFDALRGEWEETIISMEEFAKNIFYDLFSNYVKSSLAEAGKGLTQIITGLSFPSSDSGNNQTNNTSGSDQGNNNNNNNGGGGSSNNNTETAQNVGTTAGMAMGGIIGTVVAVGSIILGGLMSGNKADEERERREEEARRAREKEHKEKMQALENINRDLKRDISRSKDPNFVDHEWVDDIDDVLGRRRQSVQDIYNELIGPDFEFEFFGTMLDIGPENPFENIPRPGDPKYDDAYVNNPSQAAAWDEEFLEQVREYLKKLKTAPLNDEASHSIDEFLLDLDNMELEMQTIFIEIFESLKDYVESNKLIDDRSNYQKSFDQIDKDEEKFITAAITTALKEPDSVKDIYKDLRKEQDAVGAGFMEFEDYIFETYGNKLKEYGITEENWNERSTEGLAIIAAIKEMDILREDHEEYYKRRGEEIFKAVEDYLWGMDQGVTQWQRAMKEIELYFDEQREELRLAGKDSEANLARLDAQEQQAIQYERQNFADAREDITKSVASDYLDALNIPDYEKELISISETILNYKTQFMENMDDTSSMEEFLGLLGQLEDQLLANARAARDNARYDVFKSMVDYSESVTTQVNAVSAALRSTNQNFFDYRSSLEQLGASAADLNAVEQLRMQTIRDQAELLAEQMFSGYFDSIRSYRFSAMSSGWEIDDYKRYSNQLFNEISSTNPVTDTDEIQRLISEQLSVAQQIRTLEEQQLASNKQIVSSINATLFELRGGSAAPVQSREYYEQRYNELLYDTRHGTDEDKRSAVEELNSFVPQYLEFMAAYTGRDQAYDNYEDLLRRAQLGDEDATQQLIDQLGYHIDTSASDYTDVVNQVGDDLEGLLSTYRTPQQMIVDNTGQMVSTFQSGADAIVNRLEGVIESIQERIRQAAIAENREPINPEVVVEIDGQVIARAVLTVLTNDPSLASSLGDVILGRGQAMYQRVTDSETFFEAVGPSGGVARRV